MDYRSRKINTRNINLSEFIQQLAAGKFLIPTFQRLFIWDPEHIVNLWDSIYRCYPIGSILCWKTHTRLHVHRRLGGFLLPEGNESGQTMHAYILDGQQRATALVASFYGGAGKIREQFSFDFTLYFDLSRAEFFFEKDYYRHRWDSDPAFLIRVNDAPDLTADYRHSLASLRGFSESAEKNLEQLQFVFTDYSIPLISLEGYDIAGVCGIYERINQTGVRLTNMDILIARGFKNYATVVEEDFPVPQ
ncbi:MAG TPA: DUF262 domain-containing protein [Acidobacteriota bacterium]|nr:DUF262 domain-containing protein [Acidobacteriota bacterium]